MFLFHLNNEDYQRFSYRTRLCAGEHKDGKTTSDDRQAAAVESVDDMIALEGETMIDIQTTIWRQVNLLFSMMIMYGERDMWNKIEMLLSNSSSQLLISQRLNEPIVSGRADHVQRK